LNENKKWIIAMMNADDIRSLSYYLIPKDWIIHLIDRKTDEKQLEIIQQIIENARLLAFDTGKVNFLIT
jgi:hypothetical protein